MAWLDLHFVLGFLGALVWVRERIHLAPAPPTPLRLNTLRVCVAAIAGFCFWFPWEAPWCAHPVLFTSGMTALGFAYLWLLASVRRLWPARVGTESTPS
jgi:hypothetical protein